MLVIERISMLAPNCNTSGSMTLRPLSMIRYGILKHWNKEAYVNKLRDKGSLRFSYVSHPLYFLF